MRVDKHLVWPPFAKLLQQEDLIVPLAMKLFIVHIHITTTAIFGKNNLSYDGYSPEGWNTKPMFRGIHPLQSSEQSFQEKSLPEVWGFPCPAPGTK